MRIDEQPRHRWADEQPRTRWVEQPAIASRRPDLRLGSRSHRLDRAGGTAVDRIAVQHTVRTSTAEYSLLLNAPNWLGRRGVGEALADAVAELRAIDLTYGPNRRDSLVSRLRRGEISPESYPPLADLVDRCAAMRAATDGWFDAWAVPGGFDPGGLLGGWAVERAAARLRTAGIHDYAVLTGADLVVRGHAAHGGPWRVAVHHPTDPRRPPLVLEMTAGAVGTSGVTGRRGHVVDPHTGEPADQLDAATVIGPDLAVADAYATALYAAGPTGLAWFRTGSDYRALFAHRRR
ncbi:Thiamine biosynthesis lipoprotein ApbE precursor [Micromonospora sp. MW-13]|uniref:FAD:protein FMN transferase n=1 Tax=unclassified Micromonospora TaxID=2617518 RepID=UPI000E44A432|nr:MULTISPECIES: FAD:protein FMN transferase [unclassified Micromonospora]MCX4473992.1 FAD:protein FMN transferase [Micromonospora sp. NBC_01655]RGC69911.1 Thiamine biosynthesis lipoprotein ApbE precursor [Micromonospora sp. MW-13]